VGLASQLHLRRALRAGAAHSDGAVRAAALEALVPHTPGRALLPLLERAMRERDPALRTIALRAAARLGTDLGRPAVELLWRGTFATDRAERQTAFTALSEVRGAGAPAAQALLALAARDASEDRRRLAFAALGRIAPEAPDAAELLLEGATDPAHDVRREAQSALAAFLARFASQEALWRLLEGADRDGLVRRLATAALARQAQRSGAGGLRARAAKLPRSAALELRVAANLAAALARRGDPPEGVIRWLYGWEDDLFPPASR
jgi:hypothetical protein